MNRVQRALGYLGVVMLVVGVAITAVGPARVGIADDAPTGVPTATDVPVAAASVPDGAGNASGDAAPNANDTTSDGARDRTSPSDDGSG